ncbi:MAG: FtsX-like permease family protein, partial [Candidatus Poseidoniaceae archaeon]|nr:FtsX-like permease family protein [Candidatus Poseidoniaceae archaeon]
VIGTAEEGLSWFELEEINRFSTTPQVVVNQVFSDELEVGVGDEIQLGWFVRNQNGVERIEENFTIHQVVAMAGQGQLAGTTSPALFTDLLSAQEWQQSEGNVTSIRISLDGVEEKRSAVTPVLDEIARTLNASIGVSESGLQLIAESNAVTVASTNGLGRLSPRIVQSLFENKTSLMQEAMMLEVLQVPLVGLDSSSSNLLTLADGDLNGVMHEDGTLWHWGPAGFGYESKYTSWVWRVPSGEIINDVTIDGGLGFAAFDDGLVLGKVSDDDATDYIIEEREMVAVASNSTSWYAIEGGESASLWFGNLGDGSAEHTPLSIDLPSTILNWDLMEDEASLYLRIEGILSETYYKRMPGIDKPFVEIGSEEWPSVSHSSPSVCPGFGVDVNETRAWCIEEGGLFLRSTLNGDILSMRLPILSDAGGFGTLPQMFFAFDGDASTLLVEQGDLRIGQRLEPLSTPENSNMTASGLFQYAFGSDESLNLTINGSFLDDDRLSSLSDLDPVILGLVNMSDAEFLAAAEENERSMLVFSNVSTEEQSMLESHLDLLVGIDDLSLSVQAVKLDALEQAEASSGVLTAMFLVFGSFTIAAGILLVVTIITMLIDVRQKEYATVRALGMTRADLRYIAMIEGSIAALIGCALGSILGVGLAWLIGIGFSSVFASAGADVFSFHVDSSSLLAGWFWGFHIAML